MISAQTPCVCREGKTATHFYGSCSSLALRHGRWRARRGARRMFRTASRFAGRRRIDRLQIIGQHRRRIGAARIMLSQEVGQREMDAALGKPARIPVTGRATVREQFLARFTPIEILCGGYAAREQDDRAEHQQPAPQSPWRRQIQHHTQLLRPTQNRPRQFESLIDVQPPPARRSAYSIASIMLRSLAMPLPAISNAVP